MTQVREAEGTQPVVLSDQPEQEALTPEEWMLVRYYRQLDEPGRVFMRRAFEALVRR